MRRGKGGAAATSLCLLSAALAAAGATAGCRPSETSAQGGGRKAPPANAVASPPRELIEKSYQGRGVNAPRPPAARGAGATR